MKRKTEALQAELSKFVSLATQKTIEAVCQLEGVPAGSHAGVHTALSAIVPALMLLTMAVTRCPGRACTQEDCCHTPPNRIQQNSMFFCALLVAYSVQGGKVELLDSDDQRIHPNLKREEEDGVAVGTPINVSGDVFIDAARAYETLSGTKPDKFLEDGLVEFLKQAEASSNEANEMLAKLIHKSAED